MAKHQEHLSLFGFLTITGSIIMNVYVYPDLSTSGFSAIFFLLCSAICYFIPTALISAELATAQGWGKGGIYSWVNPALAERSGFAAAFFQWF